MSDSGISLTETGTPQDLTAIDAISTGKYEIHSGMGHSDTGTAVSLPTADKSANKSASREITTYVNAPAPVEPELTPEKLRELVNTCSSLPDHLKAAIGALLQTVLKK